MRRRRPFASAAVAATLLAGLAACGGDDGGDDEGAGGTGTTAPTDDTAPDGTAPAGSGTTGTAPTGTGDDGDLPGEPIDIYPYEGDSLGVVGVAYDDTLNLRSGPGTDFDVVAELGNLEADVIATGRNRTLDGGGIWGEVTFDGTTGWANLSFLAHLGATTDVTADLPPDLGGETMLDLGQAVAEARGGTDEPVPSSVVVDEPVVGDLGEVTVDLTGYGDDAQLGERLHVFGTPDPSGEAFRLRSVEAQALCRRGVTPEGLCV
jgi:hypothetical protein